MRDFTRALAFTNMNTEPQYVTKWHSVYILKPLRRPKSNCKWAALTAQPVSPWCGVDTATVRLVLRNQQRRDGETRCTGYVITRRGLVKRAWNSSVALQRNVVELDPSLRLTHLHIITPHLKQKNNNITIAAATAAAATRTTTTSTTQAPPKLLSFNSHYRALPSNIRYIHMKKLKNGYLI